MIGFVEYDIQSEYHTQQITSYVVGCKILLKPWFNCLLDFDL